jgi:hypothetical protein
MQVGFDLSVASTHWDHPAYRESWATFGIGRANVNRFGPVLLEDMATKVALADPL